MFCESLKTITLYIYIYLYIYTYIYKHIHIHTYIHIPTQDKLAGCAYTMCRQTNCASPLSHVSYVHLFFNLFIFIYFYLHLQILSDSSMIFFFLVHQLPCLSVHKITVLPSCLRSFTCIFFIYGYCLTIL